MNANLPPRRPTYHVPLPWDAIPDGGTWYDADQLKQLARDHARNEGLRLIDWRIVLPRAGGATLQVRMLVDKATSLTRTDNIAI